MNQSIYLKFIIYFIIIFYILLNCFAVEDPGNQTEIDDNRNRILQGSDCLIEHHPYLVLIRRKTSQVCGGSLLQYSWVLTAGHCFATKQKSKGYFVVAGMDSIENLDKRTVQISKIESYKVHPMHGKMNHKHDIAVAKLARPMIETKYVKSVNLVENSARMQPICKKGQVLGFGRQSLRWIFRGEIELAVRGPYTPNLQCLMLTVPAYQLCNEYSSQAEHPIEFCAYSEDGGDTCQGDSGGPFMCQDQQVGITVRGSGCGRFGFAGTYLRVQKYRSFIEKTLEELNCTTHKTTCRLFYLIFCINSFL